MNAPRNDERWIDRATALLDESARHLDAATLSRLNRARQAALAQRRVQRRWIGGAAFAGAAVLALALGIGLHHRYGAPMSRGAAQDAGALQPGDIDILTSDDDSLDLYEDLDFYAWLDKQGGGASG